MKEINEIKLREVIKSDFKNFCNGDSNGESFLNAQYADKVIVKLDFDTAEFKDDFTQVTVEGIIDYLPVFKNASGTYISVWGDAHNFYIDDVEQEENELYLVNVLGKWTFLIKTKGYNIEFEEFNCTEINPDER